MSASKLALYGFGTTLFRTHRFLSSSFLPFSKPILFPLKPPPRRRAFSSSAATAVTSVDQDNRLQIHHPWPEWISFVDRLSTKGYLTKSSSSGDDGDDAVYVNMNLLKDACLSFGRDRYDLFRLLSSSDLQAIVEGGCPNLLRKAVNSAKRLRAHLQLDEGDVCSACHLRGSCDRAYVIMETLGVDARTVDVVRILLFYALDPVVLSGGEKPSGRELVELSVRKLLSQLIELSESSPAPAPHAPVPARSKPTAQNALAEGRPLTSTTSKFSKEAEMKKHDWICQKCNFMNFSRNTECLNCKKNKPKDVDLPTNQMSKGDWICPECSFMNFSRNFQCLKCKTEGPKRINPDEVEMKKGDWNCPQCGFMNFASKSKCLRCSEQRPKKHPGDWSCSKCGFMNFASKVKCLHCQEPSPSSNKYQHPGDWSCPKCNFYNYARNKNCLKCNIERPKEQPTSEHEEHVWKRSY
ncbi:zinc finger protein VAR3, chloroplastic [Arachis duranensis]|uniref:Zinc finger protein VAR3, chloroplastic n=1 Tax=Arachis duranensis TaxID=130453 RepID=A0A6P4DED5_ARADU|nr:zinc finger protein VAR3, chloroplastic [Arachis duranensis]